MKLWTPEEPFLYDLEVTLLRGGRVLDRVGSYAAMRKISVKRTVGDVYKSQILARFIIPPPGISMSRPLNTGPSVE